MADSNETWSERFVREVDAFLRLVRQRPTLAIVFIFAIAFYGWHQFLKEKTETIPKYQGDKPPSMTTSRDSPIPTPAITQAPKPERFVRSIAGGAVEIYVRESRDGVSLRFRVRENWTASAKFDVNQNYTLDPHVDVAYANVGSQPCLHYLLSETSSTTCGAFRSSATFEVTQEPGSWQSTTWLIPKVEINSGGSSAWLIPDAYNTQTKESITGSFSKPIQIQFSPSEAK